MRKGDKCVVTRDKGRGHPTGTIVEIIDVCKETNLEPYCGKAVDGQTSYWYSEEDLQPCSEEDL